LSIAIVSVADLGSALIAFAMLASPQPFHREQLVYQPADTVGTQAMRSIPMTTPMLDQPCRFCGSKMEAAAAKREGEWRQEVKNSRNLAWATFIACAIAALLVATIGI
jgi:hypothetical protein